MRLAFLLLATSVSLSVLAAADRAGLQSSDEITVWKTLDALASEGAAAKDAEPAVAALITESWAGRRYARFCYYTLQKMGCDTTKYEAVVMKTLYGRYSKPGQILPDILKEAAGPAVPEDLAEFNMNAWRACTELFCKTMKADIEAGNIHNNRIEHNLSMANIPHAAVIPRLAEIVADTKQNEHFRAHIAATIGHYGAWPGSVDPLLKGMTDASPVVRGSATRAMGSIVYPKTFISGHSGGPYTHPDKARALPALRKALLDPEPKVRTAGAVALQQLGPDAVELIPDIVTAMNRQTAKQSKAPYLAALAKTESPLAIAPLLSALKTCTEWSDQHTVVRGLGELAEKLKRPAAFHEVRSELKKLQATAKNKDLLNQIEKTLTAIDSAK